MPAPQEFHDSTLYFIRAETAVNYHKLSQIITNYQIVFSEITNPRKNEQ
jgi:hypothetical protein